MNTHNPDEEQSKSAVRKLAEHKVKQTVRKTGKKIAKKAMKKVAKLAVTAAKKGLLMLGKVLLSFLTAAGLPVIIIAIAVVLIIFLSFFISSIIFGNGQDLEPQAQELYEYMDSRAVATVDMSKPEQVPYRVPNQLIAAVLQIHASSQTGNTLKDEKAIIRKMTDELAPQFTYEQFNEWTEKQIIVCEEGKCDEGPIKRTNNFVDKLTFVNAWNGQTTTTYKARVTPWVSKEEISYRTETYKVTEEYTVLELEPYTVIEKVPYTVLELEPYKVIEKVPVYGWKKVMQCDDWNCWPHFVWDVIRYEDREVTKYREVVVTKTKEVEVTKYREVVVTKTREVEKQRQIEVKTITKTRKQEFDATTNFVESYTAFDQVLNIYGYGITDKQLIEVFYLSSASEAKLPLPPINYTNWLNSVGLGSGGMGPGFNGNIIPGAGIPVQFMEHYLSAEAKYGVDWFVLAAIHYHETGFSTHPTMISSAGAIGHMQFMPATWVGWKYNVGGGLVSSSIDITSLATIKSGGGYGVDGDNDGKADPWNLADAIHTAAHYLSKSGYSTDQRKAIFAYNHAEWYVTKVMKTAEDFRDSAVYEPIDGMPVVTDGMFMKPLSGGYVTSHYGTRSGGMHHGIDIGNNGRSTPIVAAADGKVIRSNYGPSYGNVVFLEHHIDGQLYVTVYAHLANRAVSLGQQVKKGTFLGDMGTTGHSTGIHLHFELHKGEYISSRANSQNPALYINWE
ncbi:peptidoglycan DD-metalloendopeptidase family protein [Sutcliffiella cohnii]|uniref:peptidoglycan DD-metalloendopeptidase family protein n=1 Tax=Sutcliffiella cohnii TaxID=33932 RepID=UPI00082F1C3E|nr:peptidoglycan DD-metalloendopeptidase family protein [Sutcliffiella cohnii]